MADTREVPEEERSWLERARNGDRDAFDRLAERHRAELVRACRRRLGSADDAEDVVQETLVRAFRGLAALTDPDRFRPWIHRIAANACRTRLSRSRECEPFPDEEPAAGPTSAPEHAIFSRAVLDAVASLPPDLRVAVAAYHLEGLSLGETARRLGLPETTVKGRLNRGRGALREEMIRMGVTLEVGPVEFAPSRVAVLLAPGTAYGIRGEDVPALARRLRDAGFRTTEVPTAKAAGTFSRTIPHLLLLADDVPGVDAFALIRDLRAAHRTRGIVLILLARPKVGENGPGEERAYRAWEAGVDCFLTLPCNPEELVGLALRLERMSRAQQAMILATDLAWRGEAALAIRYLRAATEQGGEAQREEARRSVAFRSLHRNDEFRALVGEVADL